MTDLERLCRKYGEITHIQDGREMIDTRADKILKPGATFKVKRVDFTSPEIEEIREVQQECLERKKVDWNKLRNTYINI